MSCGSELNKGRISLFPREYSFLNTQDQIIEMPDLKGKKIMAKCSSFTLNSAFEQIGGFGRFQFISIIIFSLLRSYGQLIIYLYAQNTEPIPFLCRTDSGAAF